MENLYISVPLHQNLIMSDITCEIIVITILLIANGILSMSEMAVVSSHKTRLHKMTIAGTIILALTVSYFLLKRIFQAYEE